MDKISNWVGQENATMKGYVLYALALLGEAYPELELSEEQKKCS